MSDDLIRQLQLFISRVSDLEKKDEYDEDGFSKEFRELRTLADTHKEENKYPAEEGKKDQNMKKNRYKDILPFDATRVTLESKPDDKESDYINANFVKGADGKMAYIASQGPLPQTVVDFWRMLWQYKIQVVAMVCQVVEDGKAKCERYWSPNVNEIKKIGDFNIKMTKEDKVFEYFFTRSLSVWRGDKESEKQVVTQYHYTGWMDHDIPHDFSDIIQLINRMREKQTDESIPLVIHCSAGCGRTGTICAIDYAWNVLKGGIMSDEFSLRDIILDMRSQRKSLVQTPDQYKVVHLAVKEMFEDHLQLIDQHNYENVYRSKRGSQEETTASKDNRKSKVKQAKKNGKIPSSLPLSSPGTSKSANTKSTDKKPLKPLSRPILSPKPVVDGNAVHPTQKSSSDADQTELLSSKAGAQVQKAESFDYQNVTIDQETHVAVPDSSQSKFVSRITVGSNSGIASPLKPARSDLQSEQVTNLTPQKGKKDPEKQTSRPPAYCNQDLPGTKGKTEPKSPPAYSNQVMPGGKGQGKPKKPVANQNVPRAKDQSLSKYSNQEVTVSNGKAGTKISPAYSNQEAPKEKTADTDNINRNARVASQIYSEAKKTFQSDKASISKRAPAPLPPDNSNAINKPYEDVSAVGSKDYSYAEPNSTDKWPLQELARKFDHHAGTKPSSGIKSTLAPQAYEEVNVSKPNTRTGYQKLGYEFGEGAYATVADDLSAEKLPAVPVKTEGAYIYNEADENQNGKKKLGLIGALINKIPKPGGHKTESEPNKGVVKHRDDGVAVFNNKLIPGFNKRGKPPKGPRAKPVAFDRYESSL